MTDTSDPKSSYPSCVLPRTSIESDFPERPLRDELLSADQLERYAGHLASSHSLAVGRVADKLFNRLTENERCFNRPMMVAAAVTKNRRIDPAASGCSTISIY